MATVRKFWKEQSKIDWYCYLPEKEPLSDERIQLGAILRIADATEVMAKRYQELINERDMHKREADRRLDKMIDLENRIAGLRGYITRLKRTLKN